MKTLGATLLVILFPLLLSHTAHGGVGVGTSLDSETVVPVMNDEGDFVYHAKFLCGTIAHNELNPQLPALFPFGPVPYAPGSYFSYLNMLNPHSQPVDLELRFQVAAVIGVPDVAAFVNDVESANGLRTLSEIGINPDAPHLTCDTLIGGFLDFGSDNYMGDIFAFIIVNIISQAEINVVSYQSVKNVLLSNARTIFFDCVVGPVTSVGPTWSEVTSLIVTNSGAVPRLLELFFINGRGQLLGRGSTLMPGRDIAQINVCRSLAVAGLPAVPKGQIIILSPFFNCWIIDYLGKFFQSVNEPTDGRVVGVAKTACSDIDIDVVALQQTQQLPVVDLIFIGGTGL